MIGRIIGEGQPLLSPEFPSKSMSYTSLQRRNPIATASRVQRSWWRLLRDPLDTGAPGLLDVSKVAKSWPDLT
jgi:hypothetical protein